MYDRSWFTERTVRILVSQNPIDHFGNFALVERNWFPCFMEDFRHECCQPEKCNSKWSRENLIETELQNLLSWVSDWTNYRQFLIRARKIHILRNLSGILMRWIIEFLIIRNGYQFRYRWKSSSLVLRFWVWRTNRRIILRSDVK